MILDRLRRGERLRRHETVRVRRHGTQFAVALTISPILNAAGTIIGASKIVRISPRSGKSGAHPKPFRQNWRMWRG